MDAMTMQSTHSSVTGQIIALPILIIAFNIMIYSVPHYSPSLIHLHNALNEFSVRGQLTLELFAPLSATLGPSRMTLQFLTSTCQFLWASIATAFFQVSHLDNFLTSGSLFKKSLLYFMFVGSVTLWPDLFKSEHLPALVFRSLQ